jgi:FkbM family methyltransferase
MVSRIEWYSGAAENLGLVSLARLQCHKLLSRWRSNRNAVKLTSRYLAHPVLARSGTSDLLVFDQVLVEREYRCLDELSLRGLIIDCGANVGYSSAYFLSVFPEAVVVAVEPDPSNFSMLTTNLAPYRGRCTAIQGAVWPDEEALRLNPQSLDAGYEWGRSVEKADAAGELVKAVTIPQLIAASSHDRVSLLKIDIEGAEYELFERGVSDWIGQVDNIVIELHGTNCAESFFRGIGGEFEVSKCDELTVCFRRAITST